MAEIKFRLEYIIKYKPTDKVLIYFKNRLRRHKWLYDNLPKKCGSKC
jgi:hypothetical protein